METRRLGAFIKIVESGALSRAAEQMGVAQPSLSQQVLDLEAHFGAKLLTRTKRGVTPTTAGELLYRHAHIILRQIEQASQELKQASTEVSGEVSIGLPGSIAPVLALALLQKVRRLHPNVTLRIIQGSYSLINELTLNGRLDLAVSGAASLKGIRSTPLVSDELVLVSAPDLAADLPAGDVTVAEIAHHPLVLTVRLGGRTLVHEVFANQGLEPNVVGELESPYDILGAVRENIGSTIIAWVAAAHLAEDLAVRRIVPPIQRVLYLEEPEILPSTASTLAVKTLIIGEVGAMVRDGRWPGGVLL